MELNLRILRTQDERSRGLMFVAHLDENEGALFVFDRPQELFFWGKNTLIDLDIAFIDDEWNIVKISTIKKHDLKSVSSGEHRCPYALEMNIGWFERHGYRVGDRLEVTA